MYDIISEKKAMTGQTVYGERKRLIVFYFNIYIPGMFDSLSYFDPTFFRRDSYIFMPMSSLLCQWKAAVCVR